MQPALTLLVYPRFGLAFEVAVVFNGALSPARWQKKQHLSREVTLPVQTVFPQQFSSLVPLWEMRKTPAEASPCPELNGLCSNGWWSALRGDGAVSASHDLDLRFLKQLLDPLHIPILTGKESLGEDQQGCPKVFLSSCLGGHPMTMCRFSLTFSPLFSQHNGDLPGDAGVPSETERTELAPSKRGTPHCQDCPPPEDV